MQARTATERMTEDAREEEDEMTVVAVGSIAGPAAAVVAAAAGNSDLHPQAFREYNEKASP